MTIKDTLTTVNTRVLHNYGDRHAASISAAISHATQLLGYGKLRDSQEQAQSTSQRGY